MKNQLEKLSTWNDLIKPELVWHGGGNCPHYTYYGKGYTLDTCNKKCLNEKWCTHFFFGIGKADTECVACADGATREAANPWNFYKVVRPDSPVTKEELVEFSHDLMDTLKVVVG